MKLQHRAQRWPLVAGNIGVPEIAVCNFRFTVRVDLEDFREAGHRRRRRVCVQFTKQSTKFDMSLRRYFFLIFEEQHLVLMKGLPKLEEFVFRYATCDGNAAYFGAQIRGIWTNVYMRIFCECIRHRDAEMIAQKSGWECGRIVPAAI